MRSTTIDIECFLTSFKYVQLIEKEAKTRFGRFLMVFKNAHLTLTLKMIATGLITELQAINSGSNELAKKNEAFLNAVSQALKSACKARWDAFAAKNPYTDEVIRTEYNYGCHMILDGGRFEKEIIRCLTIINNTLSDNTSTAMNGRCFIANADKRRIEQLIEQAKNPDTNHIIDLIIPDFNTRQQLATSGTQPTPYKNPFNM